MAGDDQPPDPRTAARRALTDTQVMFEEWSGDLFELVETASNAIRAHADGTFAYLQNVLDPASSPSDWVKDGLALWVSCYSRQVDLYEKTYRKLWRLPTSAPQPQFSGFAFSGGAPPGPLEFDLDQHTQAHDPIELPVPISEFGTIKLNPLESDKGRKIYPRNLRLMTSNGKVLLGLVHLKPKGIPYGDYHGTVEVGRRRTRKLRITVRKRPAP